MEGYKFSMEKVLNLREKKEKGIVETMGQIQGELSKEQDNLSRLKQEGRSMKTRPTMNIMELRYTDRYKHKLKEDINTQNEKIEEINIELDKTREELVQAQMDRKVMEKLKKKDREKYMADRKRNEQNELDEIAIIRYNGSNN